MPELRRYKRLLLRAVTTGEAFKTSIARFKGYYSDFAYYSPVVGSDLAYLSTLEHNAKDEPLAYRVFKHDGAERIMVLPASARVKVDLAVIDRSLDQYSSIYRYRRNFAYPPEQIGGKTKNGWNSFVSKRRTLARDYSYLGIGDIRQFYPGLSKEVLSAMITESGFGQELLDACDLGGIVTGLPIGPLVTSMVGQIAAGCVYLPIMGLYHYCDDMVVPGSSEFECASALASASSSMRQFGLEPNVAKQLILPSEKLMRFERWGSDGLDDGFFRYLSDQEALEGRDGPDDHCYSTTGGRLRARNVSDLAPALNEIVDALGVERLSSQACRTYIREYLPHRGAEEHVECLSRVPQYASEVVKVAPDIDLTQVRASSQALLHIVSVYAAAGVRSRSALSLVTRLLPQIRGAHMIACAELLAKTTDGAAAMRYSLAGDDLDVKEQCAMVNALNRAGELKEPCRKTIWKRKPELKALINPKMASSAAT